MNNPSCDDTPLEGEPPTEEDLLFVAIGEDIAKGSSRAVNDNLSRLITLSAAMLGGSAFVRPENIDFWPRILAVACLALSLIFAIAGNWPNEYSIVVNSPDNVRGMLNDALEYKTGMAKISATLLILGLLAGAIGSALR